MDEFELIDAIVAALGDVAAGSEVLVGPGDDCAVLAPPPGTDLVVSTDTLCAGRHFPAGWPGAAAGQRAMGVNLSDLAAMGARPFAAVVAITHPGDDPGWLVDCARGIAAAARAAHCPVVGGNLARGPMAITVTVHGVVPHGRALLRRGAAAGDRLWVSGCIGLAATGLRELLAGRATVPLAPLAPLAPFMAGGDALDRGPEPPAERGCDPVAGPAPDPAPDPALAPDPAPDPALDPPPGLALAPDPAAEPALDPAVRRFVAPDARLALGLRLAGVASACIDISDGLLAEAGHLLRASAVAVDLDLDAVPVAAGWGADHLGAVRAGDDYELLFTAPPDADDAVRAAGAATGTAVTVIGAITAAEAGEERLRVRAGGQPVALAGPPGYRHF